MEGEQPYLGDLLTMVINHLLIGMILQAPSRDEATTARCTCFRQVSRTRVSWSESKKPQGDPRNDEFFVGKIPFKNKPSK